MSNENQQLLSAFHHYKESTGETDIDMHKVAEWAASKGWELPTPPNPIDLLAKKFSRAVRTETKNDAKTGRPYRVNHAYLADAKNQLMLWIDIDEAPRPKMLKSAIGRREQVIGDLLQLTFDVDHWNSINPKDEPIAIPLDFQPDVDWRKSGGDAQEPTG